MSNHKMKRRTKIILVSVLTLGIVGGVAAKYMHGGPEAHAERFISHAQEELNLDAKQTQALTELKDELFTIGKDIKSSRTENAEQVVEMLTAPTLDQAKAVQMVRDRTETMNQRAEQLIAAIATFTDQLTPVQKQQLADKANSKMERWDRHHNH